MSKVGFIGFGNMGQAIASGLVLNNYSIYYSDIETKDFPAGKQCDSQEVLNECEIVVLAIKPHQYEEFLQTHNVDNNIIVSIAAGVTSTLMEKYCKKYILTMPNTPAMVKSGFTVVVNNESLMQSEFLEIKSIFEVVGIVKEIKEEQLSHYICVSGSSPAYFFNFIDSLSSGLSEMGLDKLEVEKQLAYVMKSAAEMILNNEHPAATLCDNVCSPGGTTIQAVNTFKSNNLERICNEAVTACYNRAEEMKIK